jgi:methionine-gamma-lyase
LNPPVYLNATYSFDSIAQGQQRFAGEVPGYVYARVENPTQSVMKKRLASLENAEDLSADIMQALDHATG